MHLVIDTQVELTPEQALTVLIELAARTEMRQADHLAFLTASAVLKGVLNPGPVNPGSEPPAEPEAEVDPDHEEGQGSESSNGTVPSSGSPVVVPG